MTDEGKLKEDMMALAHKHGLTDVRVEVQKAGISRIPYAFHLSGRFA